MAAHVDFEPGLRPGLVLAWVDLLAARVLPALQGGRNSGAHERGPALSSVAFGAVLAASA